MSSVFAIYSDIAVWKSDFLVDFTISEILAPNNSNEKQNFS